MSLSVTVIVTEPALATPTAPANISIAGSSTS